MAWFKRNRDEAPAAADDTADALAPEPAPEREPAGETPPAPAVEPAAPTAAWRTAAPMPSALTTIQRVLGAVDARSSTTLGQPAPLSLAPLGHAVTPDAPAGVISTVALADHDRGQHDHAPVAPDQPPLEYCLLYTSPSPRD